MFNALKTHFVILVFVASALFISFSLSSQNIDSLKKSLHTIGDTGKAHTLERLSEAYIKRSPDTALMYAQQAVYHSTSLNDAAGLAKALYKVALAYQQKGNLLKTKEYLLKSLEEARKAGNKKLLSESLNNTCFYFRINGEFPVALNYALEGLKISEELGDKKDIARDYRTVGLIYYNIGVSSSSKDFSEPLKYFKKAYDLYRALGDSGQMAVPNNDIGNIHLEMSKINKKNNQPYSFDEVLPYYRETVRLATKFKKKEVLSIALHNIGTIFGEKKMQDSAIKYFEKSLVLKEEMGNKLRISNSLRNLAEVYLEKYSKTNNNSDYSTGMKYGTKSLKFSLETGNKENTKETYKLLGLLYNNNKQTDSSFKYMTLYYALKDSMINDKVYTQLAELQGRYEEEKKQKEEELLKEKAKAEIEQQKLITYSVFGGLVLAVLGGIIIAIGSRKRKKINILLLEKNDQIIDQKKELEFQRDLLTKKNMLITDSINYSKHIQESLFPDQSKITQHFADSFVLYKPKDIVSGDFSWINKNGNQILFAAVDCTGHGVPGAFMSIVAYNLFEQIVKFEKTNTPSAVLEQMNTKLQSIFTRSANFTKEGMDVALCAFEYTNNGKVKLQYSGAKNPIYIVSNGQLTEVKAGKATLGSKSGIKFENKEIELNKGDQVYLFSDGYIDQKGGPEKVKYFNQPFRNLIIQNSSFDMDTQKRNLEKVLEEWRGAEEQVDDILVIGIKL